MKIYVEDIKKFNLKKEHLYDHTILFPMSQSRTAGMIEPNQHDGSPKNFEELSDEIMRCTLANNKDTHVLRKQFEDPSKGFNASKEQIILIDLVDACYTSETVFDLLSLYQEIDDIAAEIEAIKAIIDSPKNQEKYDECIAEYRGKHYIPISGFTRLYLLSQGDAFVSKNTGQETEIPCAVINPKVDRNESMQKYCRIGSANDIAKATEECKVMNQIWLDIETFSFNTCRSYSHSQNLRAAGKIADYLIKNAAIIEPTIDEMNEVKQSQQVPVYAEYVLSSYGALYTKQFDLKIARQGLYYQLLSKTLDVVKKTQSHDALKKEFPCLISAAESDQEQYIIDASKFLVSFGRKDQIQLKQIFDAYGINTDNLKTYDNKKTVRFIELFAKIRKYATVAMAMSYYKKEALRLLEINPKNLKRFEKGLITYRTSTLPTTTRIEDWQNKASKIKTLFASRYGVAMSEEMLNDLKAVIQNA